MKTVSKFALAAIMSLGLTTGMAMAQGSPQTIALVKVDTASLATGYRASKLVGSSVVNDANETIGKIDDVIIGDNGKAPFAVLSVGGFLGMGDRLVVVPTASMHFSKDKAVLPGATKAGLKELVEFKYSKD